MPIHRALLLAVAVLESACASGSSDAPSLDGNWIYVDDQGPRRPDPMIVIRGDASLRRR